MVNTINYSYYMLRLNIVIKQHLVVSYDVPGLASSEVFWAVSIIFYKVFGHLRSS